MSITKDNIYVLMTGASLSKIIGFIPTMVLSGGFLYYLDKSVFSIEPIKITILEIIKNISKPF